MTILYPPIISPRRDARNGFYPDAAYAARAVYAQNHITAYRKREVFRWEGRLGDTSIGNVGGTVSHSRCRFHSGYGTNKLIAEARLGRDTGHGAVDPYVSIDVTIAGGATSTMLPDMHFGASATTSADNPDDVCAMRSTLAISANTTYEILVKQVDFCRILSLVIYEAGDGVINAATDYYNEQVPQSGARIFDSDRERLLVGLGALWRRNGGLQINWGREGGVSYTRSSATAINLIDNTTTGTPTANTPGWLLDLAYRTTYARTVVPCVLAAYASIPSGSGTVRVTDTSGTSPISVTINSATPQWFTASGELIAAAAKKYDPQWLSDGVNLITITALSLYEYET